MFGRFIKSNIVPIGIVLVCFYLINSLQFRKLNKWSFNKGETSGQFNYKSELRHQEASLNVLQKFPAFGFDNLISDFTFLSFLQYFGDAKVRRKTGYNLSPNFFEVIIDRDPRFISPYLFLSTSTSLYAGQPDKSVALMEKGLQSLSPDSDPNAYFVWLYKATDELLFLGNYQEARRSYTKVVEWAKINGDPESQRLSALSARSARFLANKPNSKSAQINAWLLVFVNSVDDNGRQRAINNIKQLGGQITFTDDGGVSVQHPQD